MSHPARALRPGLLALLVALALCTIAGPPAPARAGGPYTALSTYLGGPQSDYGRAVAVDAQGYIYIAGDTFSSSFAGLEVPRYGGRDVLVLKLSPDGKTIVGGASLGSASSDELLDMVVTPAGEPILTIMPGDTWPTKNALHSAPTSGNEGVLVKMNAAMSDDIFSTYTLFNMSNSGGQNLDIDAQGNIYVTGDRYNATTTDRKMIIQKYSPDGQRLLHEWIGSSGLPRSLDVRPNGAAAITGVVDGSYDNFAPTANAVQKLCGVKQAGQTNRSCGDDAFVVMLNPDSSTRYASYLGGSGSDQGVSIAADGSGNVVIVGSTASTDFPTTAGALMPSCKPSQGSCYYDTFVTRLSVDGQMIYSTYLNSNDAESMDFTAQVVSDAAGNATVIGRTSGERFPRMQPVQDALQAVPCVSAFTRFCYDTFITTLTPGGAMRFSSYLGGNDDEDPQDVALGPDGSIYVIGATESRNYPVLAGALQAQYSGGSDFFLSRVVLGAAPAPPPSPPPARAFNVALPMVVR